MGHGSNATTEQDVSNPAKDRSKYADPSGETMNALVWMGKNKVEIRERAWTLYAPGLTLTLSQKKSPSRPSSRRATSLSR